MKNTSLNILDKLTKIISQLDMLDENIILMDEDDWIRLNIQYLPFDYSHLDEFIWPGTTNVIIRRIVKPKKVVVYFNDITV